MANQRLSRGVYRGQNGQLTHSSGVPTRGNVNDTPQAPQYNQGNPGRPAPMPPQKYNGGNPGRPPMPQGGGQYQQQGGMAPSWYNPTGNGGPTMQGGSDSGQAQPMITPYIGNPYPDPASQQGQAPMGPGGLSQGLMPQTGGGDPMMGGGSDSGQAPMVGGLISQEQAAKYRAENPNSFGMQGPGGLNQAEGYAKYAAANRANGANTPFGPETMQQMQNQPGRIDPGMAMSLPKGFNFQGFGGFNKGGGANDGGFSQMGPGGLGQVTANAIGSMIGGGSGQAPQGQGGLAQGVPPGQGPGRPMQPAPQAKNGWTRVGAGQYKNAQGQVRNSSQNPGNIKGLLSKPPMR